MVRAGQGRYRGGYRGSHRGWLALLALLLGAVLATQSRAQDGAGSGLARLSAPIEVAAGWRNVTLAVPLTQPVPWRTRLLADPPRAVVDFRTLDWTGDRTGDDLAALTLPASVRALRVGQAGGGWSRLVIELTRPMGFAEAGMRVDPASGSARLTLVLEPLSDAAFAAQAAALAAGAANPADRAAPDEAAPAPLGQRATRIVLDPGHGGVDPGAIHEGVSEAAVMLGFARELADALRRSGRFEVVMTRDSNVFVSLEARITVAHLAGADLLVSLHADALDDGQARGATLYTLATEASDAASAMLAERHDRDDLLGGGVDLGGTDDAVAAVLMSLARARTTPAIDRLARALVAAIQGAGLRMHRHPWQRAAFSVLKSASVPSVLLEVGFLSNAQDRARLQDRDWRARMVQALIAGLDAWVAEEATRRALGQH